MRKPYYWTARRGWYVKSPDGRRVFFLATDEAQALARWRELHLKPQATLRERRAAQRLHNARLAREKRAKRLAKKKQSHAQVFIAGNPPAPTPPQEPKAQPIVYSPSPRDIAAACKTIREQRGLPV